MSKSINTCLVKYERKAIKPNGAYFIGFVSRDRRKANCSFCQKQVRPKLSKIQRMRYVEDLNKIGYRQHKIALLHILQGRKIELER